MQGWRWRNCPRTLFPTRSTSIQHRAASGRMEWPTRLSEWNCWHTFKVILRRCMQQEALWVQRARHGGKCAECFVKGLGIQWNEIVHSKYYSMCRLFGRKFSFKPRRWLCQAEFWFMRIFPDTKLADGFKSFFYDTKFVFIFDKFAASMCCIQNGPFIGVSNKL